MAIKKITPDRLREGLGRLRLELMNGPRRGAVQVLAIDDLLTSAESVARLADILDEAWNGEGEKQ